jgi:hydroxymethylglutaryl-CoA lyase
LHENALLPFQKHPENDPSFVILGCEEIHAGVVVMALEPGKSLPSQVEIIEVGPRDGLQRETPVIPVDEKVALIEDLVSAGLKRIQVTSFVHPRLVPQMADAEEVCARIQMVPGVVYSGLALNLKGVERAHKAGLKDIDISVSASNAHSLRNANRSIKDALPEFKKMYSRARAFGMTVRGGIQCAFGYLHERDVTPETVIEIAKHHLDLGVDILALADSAGLGKPRQLHNLLESVLDLAGDTPVVLHLHDTRGMGLANVLAALECGVRFFDTSFGGLGGCPFIDDATGNISTEDTVYMLREMGVQTGIDLERIALISQKFERLLEKPSLPGKLYRLLAQPVKT